MLEVEVALLLDHLHERQHPLVPLVGVGVVADTDEPDEHGRDTGTRQQEQGDGHDQPASDAT